MPMKNRALLRFVLAATTAASLTSCYVGNYGGRTAAEESRATAGSMNPSKR